MISKLFTDSRNVWKYETSNILKAFTKNVQGSRISQVIMK